MMHHILDLQILAMQSFQHEYRPQETDDDGLSLPFMGFHYQPSYAPSFLASQISVPDDSHSRSERHLISHGSRRATVAGDTLEPSNMTIPSRPQIQVNTSPVESTRQWNGGIANRKPSRLLNLITRAHGREEALKKLQDKAHLVEKSITRLLELKQQQANIAEVRTSRLIAEASEKQSEAVMLFTIVTIIFLPLTSVASIYGMNAVDFGQGQVPLSHIFKIMFPVSAGIALGILYLAFHRRLLRILVLMFAIPWAFSCWPSHHRFSNHLKRPCQTPTTR